MAYYALDNAMKFFSRRQIKIWFLIDRDERKTAEIESLVDKLSPFAQLKVLEKRELENYLLDAEAIKAFIQDLKKEETMPLEDIEKILNTQALELKDEVKRLRVSQDMLMPIHLRNDKYKGTIQEKYEQVNQELKERLEKFSEIEKTISKELEEWDEKKAFSLVPGTKVLKEVFSDFGINFNKGMGSKLASFIKSSKIDQFIRALLQDIVKD